MAKPAGNAPRVGVIVNPVAGMGGLVALHGTDGDAAAQARRLGADPIAPDRMRRALATLRARHDGDLTVMAAAGPMGEDAARAVGFDVAVVGSPVTASGVTASGVTASGVTSAGGTSAADTTAAALAMRDAGVELLLFAGGDGTAADIVGAVGTTVVVLGIPSGVKMHSGVFAHTPERAGAIAAEHVGSREPRRTLETEVVDVAPGALDPATIAVARVPRTTDAVQGPKVVRSGGTAADVRALGEQIAATMVPGLSYVLGPGLTVGSILDALGLEGTRNGFDIVVDRAIVARDATEGELVAHLERHPGSILVLGVIGGQGFLLGRGNQQVSPRVLRLIDDANIVVLADQQKIDALQPPVLHVDLGTTEPHVALRGYRRVRTSPTRTTVMRVEN